MTFLKTGELLPPEYDDMKAMLDSWIKFLAQSGRKRKKVKLSPDELNRLRALGCIH